MPGRKASESKREEVFSDNFHTSTAVREKEKGSPELWFPISPGLGRHSVSMIQTVCHWKICLNISAHLDHKEGNTLLHLCLVTHKNFWSNLIPLGSSKKGEGLADPG